MSSSSSSVPPSREEQRDSEEDEVPPLSKEEQEEQDRMKASFSTKPIVILVVGMAGSGKTTFMNALVQHLKAQKTRFYSINLDPAVLHLPYTPNIDIRETVKYKDVMAKYNLGPNGGIVTSLNLFCTAFNQVIELLEARAPRIKYILVDTPGQIEVFNWSASGTIISEALSSSFPTVMTYVVDTVRSKGHQTFMSNMLYGCSLLYKNQLPLIMAFNKIDVQLHDFALLWMHDFDAMNEVLENDSSYSTNLTRSMSVMLQEFYENLSVVGVSSLEQQGIDEYFEAVDTAKKEYINQFLPERLRRRREWDQQKEKKLQKQMEKLAKDKDPQPSE